MLHSPREIGGCVRSVVPDQRSRLPKSDLGDTRPTHANVISTVEPSAIARTQLSVAWSCRHSYVADANLNQSAQRAKVGVATALFRFGDLMSRHTNSHLGDEWQRSGARAVLIDGTVELEDSYLNPSFRDSRHIHFRRRRRPRRLLPLRSLGGGCLPSRTSQAHWARELDETTRSVKLATRSWRLFGAMSRLG
jgi:hypothetical protein